MKIILLTAGSLLLFIWNVNSQGHVKTLQPNTYSYLQGAQQMPDNTARFFLTSMHSEYGSSGQVYMIDQVAADSFEITGLLDTADFSPLGDGNEITPVFLEDGNAILLVESFQCDILFSDIIFVNQDGSVKWHMDFQDIFSPNIIDIDRVSKDVFVITDGNEQRYFDFEGQEVFFPPSTNTYLNVFLYDGFFYGAKEDGLYKMDDDFDVIDSYSLDNVTYFQHLGHHLFLVESEAGIEMITNNFDVVGMNPTLSGVLSASFNDDFLWVITEDGLHVLDQDMLSTDFHLPEINEVMKYTWVYRDTTYVASEYQSPNHTDLVIRKYLPDQFIIVPIAEAEVSNLHFPDTVERRNWNNLPYAFQYFFESMGVEITNQSEDTLRSCVINCDWSADVWCVYYVNEWLVDTIAIPPHGSTVIELGAFETDVLYYGAGPPFCFWVDNPNGRPDIFPSNDMLCGEALILSAQDDKVDTDAFRIIPNPATELITLSNLSDERGFQKAIIINNLGQIVRDYHFPEPTQSIPVHDLNPGIYHVHLTNEKSGTAHYSSFIKQ